MRLTVNGHRVEVVRGDPQGAAPSTENYLFVRVAGREYFLMVRTPGLGKRDVMEALSRHPQLRTNDGSQPLDAMIPRQAGRGEG